MTVAWTTTVKVSFDWAASSWPETSAVPEPVPVQPGTGSEAVGPLPSRAECTRLADADVIVTPAGNPSGSSSE